jgi:ribosomal protein S17
VASDKMDKTITVPTERRVKHPLYGKICKASGPSCTHDEPTPRRIGDKVSIRDSSGSQDQVWALVEILVRAVEV